MGWACGATEELAERGVYSAEQFNALTLQLDAVAVPATPAPPGWNELGSYGVWPTTFAHVREWAQVARDAPPFGNTRALRALAYVEDARGRPERALALLAEAERDALRTLVEEMAVEIKDVLPTTTMFNRQAGGAAFVDSVRTTRWRALLDKARKATESE